MNGSGSPLVGSAPVTTPEVHEGLGREHDGEPERQVAAEGVGRPQPDAQAAPDEQREERDHDERRPRSPSSSPMMAKMKSV